MNFVENLLKREPRRVKTTDAEEEEEEEEVSEKIDFTRAIKMIAKIFYEREYNKEGPIYKFDEMRRLLQEIEPSLKGFFDQFYLAARLFERKDHMKRLMVVFMCYLLVLNNTKINSFKFELAFYLDSVDTSLGVTTTSRAVDRKKKQVADEHEKYVENALTKYSKNTFLLNVDNSRPETISIL
jgi:hypothetical protein